jgi:hypothetical protein
VWPRRRRSGRRWCGALAWNLGQRCARPTAAAAAAAAAQGRIVVCRPQRREPRWTWVPQSWRQRLPWRWRQRWRLERGVLPPPSPTEAAAARWAAHPRLLLRWWRQHNVAGQRGPAVVARRGGAPRPCACRARGSGRAGTTAAAGEGDPRRRRRLRRRGCSKFAGKWKRRRRRRCVSFTIFPPSACTGTHQPKHPVRSSGAEPLSAPWLLARSSGLGGPDGRAAARSRLAPSTYRGARLCLCATAASPACTQQVGGGGRQAYWSHPWLFGRYADALQATAAPLHSDARGDCCRGESRGGHHTKQPRILRRYVLDCEGAVK